MIQVTFEKIIYKVFFKKTLKRLNQIISRITNLRTREQLSFVVGAEEM